MNRKVPITKPCAMCDAPVTRRPSFFTGKKTITCSPECLSRFRHSQTGTANPHWQGGPVEVVCAACGKTFRKFRAVIDKSDYHACSKACRGKVHSAAMSGEGNGRWEGGRIDRAGYVMIKVGREHPMANPQGYVYEHRVVMSNHIGRPLTETEIVHHRNAIKSDNRIENLVLCNSPSDHIAEHGGGMKKKYPPCWCGLPHKSLGLCSKHYQQYKTEKRRLNAH